MSNENYQFRCWQQRIWSACLGGFLLAVITGQLLTVPALGQTNQSAAEPPVATGLSLKVAEMATGHDYDPVRKAPVDTTTAFAASVEKVICFTRIEGAESPTQITHAWYHEGQMKAQVKLQVGSPNWRTYSSKRMLPTWTGQWEVKVLDTSGTILATAAFTVQ